MEFSRRGFMGAGAALLAAGMVKAEEKKPAIQGLNEKGAAVDPSRAWQEYADPGRKVRVGIAGEGVCSFGSAARMLVSWDTPSYGGEDGRIWGQKGCYVPEKGGYQGWFMDKVKAQKWGKRALPAGMAAGGHGGSHCYLTDDFIHGILVPSHKICVDVVTALNTTIAGVYAHKSALKGGEILKIPEISL